ncbi:MAG: hypothetical protein IKL53_09815 [Lachnospiraceae bacterium]|nr:hypothetical protein [Lachnospiraceae bacterium]
MTNKYVYDDLVQRKYTLLVLRGYIVRNILISLFISIYFIITAYTFGSIKYLAYLILVFILDAVVLLKIKKAIKDGLNAFHEKHNGNNPTVIVEIKDKLIIKSDGRERSMSYKSIARLMQNKKMIVAISYEGEGCLIMKDSFVEGDAKTCYSLIKKKMK